MPNPVASVPPSTPPSIELEPVVITGQAQPVSSGPPAVTSSLGDLALQCLAKMDGVVLAAAAARSGSPVIAALGALKASLELSQCVVETQAKEEVRASIERAVAECQRQGGVATGMILGEVVCAVPEQVP